MESFELFKVVKLIWGNSPQQLQKQNMNVKIIIYGLDVSLKKKKSHSLTPLDIYLRSQKICWCHGFHNHASWFENRFARCSSLDTNILRDSLCCHHPPRLSGMNLHADCQVPSLHYFLLFSLPSPLPNTPASRSAKCKEVSVFPWILPSWQRLRGTAEDCQRWARTCNSSSKRGHCRCRNKRAYSSKVAPRCWPQGK